MPRYRLTIEYDGTPFVGWQRQANGRSVQQALEEAVFRFSGEEIRVNGAGRTDAGVHATGQVAHIDLSRAWPEDTIRDAANAHLRPEPVAVLKAEAVADDFDARFSATMRAYRYLILNRRAHPALERHRVWHVARPLDADAMDEAAQEIVGLHDFTTFRSTECQAKSPVKTLERLTVRREVDTVVVEAVARSFLHNQVRSMVGSLKLVGEGKWGPGAMGRALRARDRKACGPVAPPDGLYLERVDY
ncbi:tRNA pseudouridine(38-40) synthase TruA [Lutibaculum baratangense]|uniref:tRNA pseudouridine synthase A n=1 Tax=Lutibaculum baratangense AMV1 TaxID=631454 RepID=V4RLU2_9HYPH|nr:tRNA pseudouridine(38-40) synthase TruA [Lutibaculum baratangense]ESR26986.1 tRNA pseudouridine synthase A [Lutibaculum baratangense AMV1]